MGCPIFATPSYLRHSNETFGSIMTSSPTRLLNFIFALVVLTIVYLVAMLGDFVLMRTLNAQADAVGGEGRQIMNERYQTQDRALISEAKRQGYMYRILLPSLAEEVEHLQDLARDFGFVPLGLEANSKLFICNEGHGPLKLTTDRFGYRNPDAAWEEPTSDLILVGDSFAFDSVHS